MMIVRAEGIARTAHAGQVDKAHLPYIDHPCRVAERAALISPAALRSEAIAAAWLHDVIEDTDVRLEDLSEAGMPLLVVEAVDRVTKKRGLSQIDYFGGIREHPVARMVKIADLIDNTSPDRVTLLDIETAERLRSKYAHSWELLMGSTSRQD